MVPAVPLIVPFPFSPSLITAVNPYETLAGDLRVLRTADVPELRHLRDVVVFSCAGDRPEPSKMSGGDLDGDIYAVVWDQKLLPPRQWRRDGEERNYEPMGYAPPPKPFRSGTGGVVIEARIVGGPPRAHVIT